MQIQVQFLNALIQRIHYELEYTANLNIYKIGFELNLIKVARPKLGLLLEQLARLRVLGKMYVFHISDKLEDALASDSRRNPNLG